MLRLYLNFYEYEMLIERQLCLYFSTAVLNNRQQLTSDQFNQFFIEKELNNRQIIDGMHSTKTFDWITQFKASLLAKHWTYQILNECINAMPPL